MESLFCVAALVGGSGKVTVEIAGELDMTAESQLVQCVQALPASLAANPHGQATVDLADLVFCDAQGARALSAACEELTNRGASVDVIPPRKALVRRVLTLTGFARRVGPRPNHVGASPGTDHLS